VESTVELVCSVFLIGLMLLTGLFTDLNSSLSQDKRRCTSNDCRQDS
jgi:hypothetical protein